MVNLWSLRKSQIVEGLTGWPFLLIFPRVHENTLDTRRVALWKSLNLRIQVGFVDTCNYRLKVSKGPILNCKRDGLMDVLDNYIWNIQWYGMHNTSLDVTYSFDLASFYWSCYLLNDTLRGFQTRTDFTLRVLTGMRKTSSRKLCVDLFATVTIRDSLVCKIKHSVGATNRSSKTN